MSPYDVSFPSGVNSHVANLAREFLALGHDVRMFAPGSKRDNCGDGTAVIGRPVALPVSGSVARITLSPFVGRKVKEALDRGRFDIVHIHEPFMPALSLQFLRHSRTATIGTFHAAREGVSPFYSLARPLLRRWARHLDGRIAVSPAAARLALRYVPGQYEIIPNGVDIARFAAPARCPPEITALQPYVLFVGRFEERKGLSVLLHAFAAVKARHPEVHLVVVGDRGGEAIERELTTRYAVADVHIAGHVADELLPAYYQHATVFCAPNTGNESFGVVLLEAMAAGCPVVASNIEGFAELVAYGIHGLLVPPRSPGLLADALSRVLSDPTIARRLAASVAAYASQFAWPKVAGEVLAYYQAILTERRRRPTLIREAQL